MSRIGSNIEAIEYSKKMFKILTGNFETKVPFQLMYQIGVVLSTQNSGTDDLSHDRIIRICEQFYSIQLETISIYTFMSICFFLKYLLSRYNSTKELKKILYFEIDTI